MLSPVHPGLGFWTAERGRVLSLGRIVHKAMPSLHSRLLIRRLAREALLRGDPEIRLLPRLCRKGQLMLDVGANRGVYSFIARRRGMRVVAVEPNPPLARFIRQWSGDTIQVVEAAASNRTGTAVLLVPVMAGRQLDGLASLALAQQASSACSRFPVRTIRLDDLGLSDVGLMKIDVEGHEIEVLQGAQRLLDQCRPTIIVEAEERHRRGTVEDVRRHLESRGYRGFFLWKGACRPIDEFSDQVHQDSRYVRPDGTRSGEYANNFLYVPEEECLAAVGA